MKIIVLGGFLGSGKTTLLMQLAKYITLQEGAPQVPQSRPGSMASISLSSFIFAIASRTLSASFITETGSRGFCQ